AKRHVTITAASRAIGFNFLGVLTPWLLTGLYFSRYGDAFGFVGEALLFPIKYSAATPHHLLAEPFIVLYVLAPVAVLVMSAALGSILYLGKLTNTDSDAAFEHSQRRLWWPVLLFWIVVA